MNRDYCALIVTHGRPERVITLKTLQDCGYSGKVFLVVDDQDKTLSTYQDKYGDSVIVFNKEKYIFLTDDGDNFNEKRAVIYARNACFDIAEQLGYKFFIVLDDDYTEFRYKMDNHFRYGDKKIKSLDVVFEKLFDYYKSINAYALCIAQNGDYIGGAENNLHISMGRRRKAMNVWMLSTERRFKYIGKINEDLTTSVVLQNKGERLFLTYPLLTIQQVETQQNPGGLTDIYLALGTYVKSFYSVMYAPSAVKVAMMGDTHRRLHHQVNWECAAPCIIREKWRKPDESIVTTVTL